MLNKNIKIIEKLLIREMKLSLISYVHVFSIGIFVESWLLWHTWIEYRNFIIESSLRAPLYPDGEWPLRPTSLFDEISYIFLENYKRISWDNDKFCVGLVLWNSPIIRIWTTDDFLYKSVEGLHTRVSGQARAVGRMYRLDKHWRYFWTYSLK